MAEKPILFSAPMVRALLAGRKTQTRRKFSKRDLLWWAQCGWELDDNGWPMVFDDLGDYFRLPSRYAVGDTLWVREAWMPDAPRNGSWPDTEFYGCANAPLEWIPERYRTPKHVLFKADFGEKWSWRNAMFMPRWASRLTLQVNLVRAQRVQDISWDDALAEGLAVDEDLERTVYGVEGTPVKDWSSCPIEAFARLWDSVNGDGAWERNDWAWAYTVEVCPQHG